MGRKTFTSVDGECITCGALGSLRRYPCDHAMCKSCAKQGCSGVECRLCKFDRSGPKVVYVSRRPRFDEVVKMLSNRGIPLAKGNDWFAATVPPAAVRPLESDVWEMGLFLSRDAPPPCEGLDKRCKFIAVDNRSSHAVWVCRWGVSTELWFGNQSRRLSYALARLTRTPHLRAVAMRAACEEWPEQHGCRLETSYPPHYTWVEFNAAEMAGMALSQWARAVAEGSETAEEPAPWATEDATGVGPLVFPLLVKPTVRARGEELFLASRQPVEPPPGCVTVENSPEDGPRVAVTQFTDNECIHIFQGLFKANLVMEGAAHLCLTLGLALNEWAHVEQCAAVGALIAWWAQQAAQHPERGLPARLPELPALARPAVSEMKGALFIAVVEDTPSRVGERCLEGYNELPGSLVVARGKINI